MFESLVDEVSADVFGVVLLDFIGVVFGFGDDFIDFVDLLKLILLFQLQLLVKLFLNPSVFLRKIVDVDVIYGGLLAALNHDLTHLAFGATRKQA